MLGLGFPWGKVWGCRSEVELAVSYKARDKVLMLVWSMAWRWVWDKVLMLVWSMVREQAFVLVSSKALVLVCHKDLMMGFGDDQEGLCMKMGRLVMLRSREEQNSSRRPKYPTSRYSCTYRGRMTLSTTWMTPLQASIFF